MKYHRQPGPEITGDYSRPYLYSDKTGKQYADPIYYDARILELRWRQQHGPIQTTINGNGLKK